MNSQSSNQRTWKQVKYRWLRHLDPTIIKTPFTKDEMRRVIAAQQQLGNKWTDISQLLPGRTYWQIKNLWFMKLRKMVEENNEITDQVLGTIPDDYVLKCGDFQPTNEITKKRMSDQSFSSVSMTLEPSKSVSLSGLKKPQIKQKSGDKSAKKEEKMRILIPKSAKRKRKHLNLLTNIISIPLLYTNEGGPLDISNENDSFVGVSPIRITNKPSSVLKENKHQNSITNFVDDDNDFSKLFDDCANTSHSNIVGEFDNSLSKSYDIFEGNDYLPAYDLPKIE